MTESMIERVAKALYEDETSGSQFVDLGGWDGPIMGEGGRHMYRQRARAAIAAMREPTAEMLKAGLSAQVRGPKTMQDVLDYDNEGGALEVAFPAMIDAALNPLPE